MPFAEGLQLGNIVRQSRSLKTLRIRRVNITGLVGQYDRNMQ